jgi:hypothetical protein
MAVQSECDKCKDFYPEYVLIFINLVGQSLCPHCINELINELADNTISF